MRNMKNFPFLNMFVKKRSNRGAFWASIVGLGISAAVYGVARGTRRNSTLPFRNILKNFKPPTNINMMNNTALTEFSEELLESSLNNKRNE